MKKYYWIIIGVFAMIVSLTVYLFSEYKTIDSTNRKWGSVCTRTGMKEFIDSCKMLNDSIK